MACEHLGQRKHVVLCQVEVGERMEMLSERVGKFNQVALAQVQVFEHG